MKEKLQLLKSFKKLIFNQKSAALGSQPTPLATQLPRSINYALRIVTGCLHHISADNLPHGHPTC